MLITIDTQRIAETLAAYVKKELEYSAEGDAVLSATMKDKFDDATDFLEKLGIVAYLDEHDGYPKVMVCTEDVQFLRRGMTIEQRDDIARLFVIRMYTYNNQIDDLDIPVKIRMDDSSKYVSVVLDGREYKV